MNAQRATAILLTAIAVLLGMILTRTSEPMAVAMPSDDRADGTMGACCTGSACFVGPEADCLAGGWIYLGEGTACPPLAGCAVESAGPSIFSTTLTPITEIEWAGKFTFSGEFASFPKSFSAPGVDLTGDERHEFTTRGVGEIRISRFTKAGTVEEISSVPFSPSDYDIPDAAALFPGLTISSGPGMEVRGYTDATGDGQPDLIGTLTWFVDGPVGSLAMYFYLENTSTPQLACASDIDDNGEVDFADILQVIVNWGPCPI